MGKELLEVLEAEQPEERFVRRVERTYRVIGFGRGISGWLAGRLVGWWVEVLVDICE
jgi:hypothetical protein